MQGGRQERDGRYLAWLIVVVVHAGLFWLLSTQRSGELRTQHDSGMRLVWLPPPAPPKPATVLPVHSTSLRVMPTSVPRRMSTAPIEQPTIPVPAVTAPADAATLLEQGRAWARQEAASNDFVGNPLRSRHAQLPVGEVGGHFTMRRQLKGKEIVAGVGQFLGLHPPGYETSPCPRVGRNIPGLLTSTSARDREMLQEELRRLREYCSP